MISDDDLKKAMRRLGPDAADAPDLFERVAAGARRRRRMRSSAAIVGGAAVVFGAIAIAPAAARHGGGTAPGEPALARGAAVPSPDHPSGAAGWYAYAPLEHPATSAPAAAAPSPLPTDTKGCPTIASLPPGPDAAAQARAAAVAAIPERYGPYLVAGGYTVTKVYPAASGHGFGIVADSICGKALGDNSYVVEVSLPSGSASVGNGQLFLADFPGGWQVWFQYH